MFFHNSPTIWKIASLWQVDVCISSNHLQVSLWHLDKEKKRRKERNKLNHLKAVLLNKMATLLFPFGYQLPAVFVSTFNIYIS
jgi:hypothetical protein